MKGGRVVHHFEGVLCPVHCNRLQQPYHAELGSDPRSRGWRAFEGCHNWVSHLVCHFVQGMGRSRKALMERLMKDSDWCPYRAYYHTSEERIDHSLNLLTGHPSKPVHRQKALG